MQSLTPVPVTRLSRNLLISPFKSNNRPGQVSGTSDASKTQLRLIGSYPPCKPPKATCHYLQWRNYGFSGRFGP
jgi:hypothetical protein